MTSHVPDYVIYQGPRGARSNATGAFDGGVLMSHVDLKKRQCHMSLSLKNLPCPPSNLRNDHVSCYYLAGPRVAVSNVYMSPCRI